MLVAQGCRVLIAEHTPRFSRLSAGLFTRGVLEVVRPVAFADLVDAVVKHKPQVVLLELEDGREDAIAAVEQLMADRPTPILLLCEPGAAKQAAIRALAAGALDVIEIPQRLSPSFFERMRDQLQMLAGVSVLPHVRGRRKRIGTLHTVRHPFPLVVIAASLGGPRALAEVIKGLPRSFTAPMVICQHITTGFADDLARWLQLETGRDVVEVTEAQKIETSRVYVATTDVHLAVHPGPSLELDRSPAVGGFRPAGDVLLRTAASVFGEQAIGVVLTGMGRDGAQGLKEIRARGGHTIAQDELTSVVFGMPGEAIKLGGAEKILPLQLIAAQLWSWVQP